MNLSKTCGAASIASTRELCRRWPRSTLRIRLPGISYGCEPLQSHTRIAARKTPGSLYRAAARSLAEPRAQYPAHTPCHPLSPETPQRSLPSRRPRPDLLACTASFSSQSAHFRLTCAGASPNGTPGIRHPHHLLGHPIRRVLQGIVRGPDDQLPLKPRATQRLSPLRHQTQRALIPQSRGDSSGRPARRALWRMRTV
jgi:hypothetical protein